jgi:hypothetical protein
VETLEIIQFLEQSHQQVEVADLLVTRVFQLLQVVLEVEVVTEEVLLLGPALLERQIKVIVVVLLPTLDKIIQLQVEVAQVLPDQQILLIYKVAQVAQEFLQASQGLR